MLSDVYFCLFSRQIKAMKKIVKLLGSPKKLVKSLVAKNNCICKLNQNWMYLVNADVRAIFTRRFRSNSGDKHIAMIAIRYADSA